MRCCMNLKQFVRGLCALIFLSFPTFLIAQERLVSGKVSNQEGEPLQQVSVTLKGTTETVTTNNLGEFRINVPNPRLFW